jgi:hypothetical protein
MKKLALLAIPMCLVFLLFLAIEDGFSRGGGRGGGGGGGFGGGGGGRGGASYSGGAASRSPSMSSSSPSRSSASQSKPKQSSNVASRPQHSTTPSKAVSQQQRPATPSKAASQRPSTSGQKPSSAAGSKVASKGPATGGGKPSQGQVQDFLNLPQQGGKGMSDLGKIGAGAAAGALGYAGAKQLLGSQGPGGERPGAGDRGGVGERPGEGDRLQASTLPAERPGVGGPGGVSGPGGVGGRPGVGDRPSQLPSRANAGQIRDNLQGRYDNIFTPQGLKDHPQMANAYWQNFGKYQYARNHWWRPAAWASLGGWVAGSSWESPAYYDYGEGIYYEDEQVYAGGKPVASAEEYYQQASDLATSAPPAQASEIEWLPLGVFAISRAQATDSNALLQLAVDKDGVIAGTYYNTSTDIGRPVRGRVDKKTQRAAWTFSDGKNTDIIMETGISNLTQDQTEALVHFGKEKSQQWLMVRLEQPKDTESTKEGGK